MKKLFPLLALVLMLRVWFTLEGAKGTFTGLLISATPFPGEGKVDELASDVAMLNSAVLVVRQDWGSHTFATIPSKSVKKTAWVEVKADATEK